MALLSALSSVSFSPQHAFDPATYKQIKAGHVLSDEGCNLDGWSTGYNVEECGSACWANDKCKSFSHHKAMGQCWLKSLCPSPSCDVVLSGKW
jgi:hypothetical protein